MHYKKVRPHTIKNLSVNTLDALAIGAADRGQYPAATKSTRLMTLGYGRMVLIETY
jgi:hypothetical protein